MSMPIAFVDCETTHLDAEIGEAWEFAVILREFEDGQHTDTEYAWQIRPNLAKADPEALRIGRYEARFAVPDGVEAAWTAEESGHVAEMTRREAVTAIVNVLSGAVIVGSNPGFDDRHLRRLVGRGRAKWHYRPYDIVQLAAAKIGAQQAGPLPWSSYALSRAVGVEPPSKEAAHTALGDARWARDVYDAATHRQPYEVTVEGRAQHAMGLYTKTAIELEDARRDLAASMAAIKRASKLATHWAVLRAYGGAATELRAALGGQEPSILPGGFTAETCVTVKCVVCEYEFDEDDSHIVHFEDLDTAHATLRGYDWTVLADGSAICPDDDAEHQALRGPGDDPSTPVSPGQTALDTSDLDEEFEETDSDSDVLELISEIAARLSDATDEGEYHAVGLISDLANGRKTIAEARAELAEITFRHV
ncbi:3'-5' exonuclease [Streptomyces turgidiscabies]|uniref:3'-5' exonuclease n=1 Tax=Streptomyces turgidiscabies TaxID=85558 RepID=UPI0038F6C245